MIVEIVLRTQNERILSPCMSINNMLKLKNNGRQFLIKIIFVLLGNMIKKIRCAYRVTCMYKDGINLAVLWFDKRNRK